MLNLVRPTNHREARLCGTVRFNYFLQSVKEREKKVSDWKMVITQQIELLQKRRKDEQDIKDTLSSGINLYEKYIDPKQIIKFIESNLTEND